MPDVDKSKQWIEQQLIRGCERVRAELAQEPVFGSMGDTVRVLFRSAVSSEIGDQIMFEFDVTVTRPSPRIEVMTGVDAQALRQIELAGAEVK